MTDLRNSGPEFHVVVRHQDRRGPLGPYRLTLAVAFALLVAANDLLAAATTGVGIDRALTRAAVAALFIWILSGVVSRILVAGTRPHQRPPTAPAGSSDTAPRTDS